VRELLNKVDIALIGVTTRVHITCLRKLNFDIVNRVIVLSKKRYKSLRELLYVDRSVTVTDNADKA